VHIKYIIENPNCSCGEIESIIIYLNALYILINEIIFFVYALPQKQLYLNLYQGQDCQIIVNLPKVECSVDEIDFEKDDFVDEYIKSI
jgi:hypothetical protein